MALIECEYIGSHDTSVKLIYSMYCMTVFMLLQYASKR